MQSMLTSAAPSELEAFLLRLPGGYSMLDMLVQANVDLRRLTREELEQMLAAWPMPARLARRQTS